MAVDVNDDKQLDDNTGRVVMSDRVYEVDAYESDIIKAEHVIKAEHEYTEAQFRKLRWKIDLHIMPVMMLVYGLQYS